MADIEALAKEQGVEPFDPETFEPMTPITPAEMQEILLNNFKDDLVSKGWTLLRDNKNGGAMVLTGDGIRVVASIHTYPEKDLPPMQVVAEEAPCSTATTAATTDPGPSPDTSSDDPSDNVKSADVEETATT